MQIHANLALKVNNEPYNIDALQEHRHMIEWLDPEPEQTILPTLERNFSSQVQGSVLTGFRVTETPQWLTQTATSENGRNELSYHLLAQGSLFLSS